MDELWSKIDARVNLGHYLSSLKYEGKNQACKKMSPAVLNH